MRIPFGFCLIPAAAAVAFIAVAQTEPGEQAQPRVRSLSHAIHAVEDLDTTLAFYRDVFGLIGTPRDFPNPAVPLLTNAPGVTLRLSMMQLPGSMLFELTHFKGLERKPARAAYTDPGAASMVFYVRDIDTAVTNAKKANAPIVTTGGVPVEITTAKGKARSILMRDPDGFFIQVVQEAPAPGAPEGNVHHVSLAYTMENAESTVKFYNGMLGLELTGPSAFSKDPAMLKLVGAPAGTEFRKTGGRHSPARPPPVEFTEFRGVPRTKFHLRVRDPGAPAMAIQVINLVGMIGEMKGAGVNVISANAQIVDFGGGTHTIFVEDPNGMNLELFERSGSPRRKSRDEVSPAPPRAPPPKPKTRQASRVPRLRRRRRNRTPSPSSATPPGTKGISVAIPARPLAGWNPRLLRAGGPGGGMPAGPHSTYPSSLGIPLLAALARRRSRRRIVAVL